MSNSENREIMKTPKYITAILMVLMTGFASLNGQKTVRNESRETREQTAVRKIQEQKPAQQHSRAVQPEKNMQRQVLLGVTGSGKTFTMANIISRLNIPTLVLSPNKTLENASTRKGWASRINDGIVAPIRLMAA